MAEPILGVERLTVRFDVSPPWLVRTLTRTPRRIVHAVEDVSFAIATGTTLALVGESGCGKSTIARTIAGIQRPTSGQVRFAGQRGRDLQMVFQDPYASLDPGWRVGRSIAEPIVTHDLLRGATVIRARVAELLELVGLSPADASKRPHQFSGGQRQRIAIARAIASQPAFLVCDEPTSALDVSVQAQIVNLLGRLQRRLGLTTLLISHSLGVVAHMADTLGVMYLGRLVEYGDAGAIIAAPLHPYTRMLLHLVTRPGPAGGRQKLEGEVPSPLAPPPGCAFHPRCPFADSRCRSEPPAQLPAGPVHVACHAVQEDRLP
jgi:peptide/nickel transport system ATP-binding protein